MRFASRTASPQRRLTEEREHDRHDGPGLGYSHPAAYLVCEAAQQQSQKSGPEGEHQHIRKLPDSKPRCTDKAHHQDSAREWGSGRFGPFHFLLRDDNLHIFLLARIPRAAHSATDTSGTKGIFPLIQINFVRSGRPTFCSERVKP